MDNEITIIKETPMHWEYDEKTECWYYTGEFEFVFPPQEDLVLNKGEGILKYKPDAS